VYLPKCNSYGHPQAHIRGCLTAIDHNYNADRQPLLDHDGEEMYNVVSTRDGLVYTAKTIKEPKNTQWRKEILSEVLQVRIKFVRRYRLAKYYFVFLSVVDPHLHSNCPPDLASECGSGSSYLNIAPNALIYHDERSFQRKKLPYTLFSVLRIRTIFLRIRIQDKISMWVHTLLYINLSLVTDLLRMWTRIRIRTCKK
jgi:hypothetical protein